MTKTLYKLNNIDITGKIPELGKVEAKYVMPHRASAIITIEENVTGFVFYVISSRNEIKISADTKHNKKVNPNIKFDAQDAEDVITKRPGGLMERFTAAPFPEYTAIFVHFDKNILEEKHVNYPKQGLFLVDIVSHDTKSPLDVQHKENFAKRLGVPPIPKKFHGTIKEGLVRMDFLANTSLLAKNNLGNGIRVTFEPRDCLDVYCIYPEDDKKMKYAIDSPATYAEEMVNFIITPQFIADVADLSNKNPLRHKKTFIKEAKKYLLNKFSNFFYEYFYKIKNIDEKYTEEDFNIAIDKLLATTIKKNAEQMDMFILIEDKKNK